MDVTKETSLGPCFDLAKSQIKVNKSSFLLHSLGCFIGFIFHDAVLAPYGASLIDCKPFRASAPAPL